MFLFALWDKIFTKTVRVSTGNTAPNDTKENDITLLLEIVDQFCKKIQRALKKRFFTVQFRVYEEELLSAHIVLKNYSFF